MHVWIDMDPLPNTRRMGLEDCSLPTCIHIIGPTAGLRAASSRRGTAWVEDIIHRALHLTVINGLPLVGAERTKERAWVERWIYLFFLLIYWVFYLRVDLAFQPLEIMMKLCTTPVQGKLKLKSVRSRFQTYVLGRVGVKRTLRQIWLQLTIEGLFDSYKLAHLWSIKGQPWKYRLSGLIQDVWKCIYSGAYPCDSMRVWLFCVVWFWGLHCISVKGKIR